MFGFVFSVCSALQEEQRSVTDEEERGILGSRKQTFRLI